MCGHKGCHAKSRSYEEDKIALASPLRFFAWHPPRGIEQMDSSMMTYISFRPAANVEKSRPVSRGVALAPCREVEKRVEPIGGRAAVIGQQLM
jgi:hypothetical protein